MCYVICSFIKFTMLPKIYNYTPSSMKIHTILTGHPGTSHIMHADIYNMTHFTVCVLILPADFSAACMVLHSAKLLYFQRSSLAVMVTLLPCLTV